MGRVVVKACDTVHGQTYLVRPEGHKWGGTLVVRVLDRLQTLSQDGYWGTGEASAYGLEFEEVDVVAVGKPKSAPAPTPLAEMTDGFYVQQVPGRAEAKLIRVFAKGQWYRHLNSKDECLPISALPKAKYTPCQSPLSPDVIRATLAPN